MKILGKRSTGELLLSNYEGSWQDEVKFRFDGTDTGTILPRGYNVESTRQTHFSSFIPAASSDHTGHLKLLQVQAHHLQSLALVYGEVPIYSLERA